MFLVLDGLPIDHVVPETMPVLSSWCVDSRTAPHSIPGVLPASTYPNHATWVTGELPVVHGIVGNHVRGGDGRFRPAAQVGPQVPTIFDLIAAADLTSAVVVSDQDLIGVLGARAATTHWPPDGVVPDDAATDAHGYLDDSVTMPWLLAALADEPDLVFGHLNAPDTAAHVHGPDGGAAISRETDARLGAVRAAIEARHEDTVVVVASDHAAESISQPEPIDLTPALEDTELTWFPEGSAALVYGEHHDVGALLTRVSGIAGVAALAPDLHLVWGEVGRWLCFAGVPAEPGTHGSPRTAWQLAAVVGTHPEVQALDARVGASGFDATSWFGELHGLVGLP